MLSNWRVELHFHFVLTSAKITLFVCRTFGNPKFDCGYVKAVPGCRMMKVSVTALSPHPTKDCGPCDFYTFRHSALMTLFNFVTCCILWIITVWGEPPPTDIFLATGLWRWLLRQRVDMLNFVWTNHSSACLLSSCLLHFEKELSETPASTLSNRCDFEVHDNLCKLGKEYI